MSATILDVGVVCNSLGVSRDDVAAYRMKNRFPVDNRKVYFYPSGSLNYRSKTRTFPKLIQDVDSICSTYPNSRGIIHTHNFERYF